MLSLHEEGWGAGGDRRLARSVAAAARLSSVIPASPSISIIEE